MIINEEILLLLLQIVNKNGDIKMLVSRGYDYFQILKLIEYAKQKKYITREGETLNLTKIGEKYISRTNNKLNRSNNAAWISPADHEKCEKLTDEEIYVPNRKKIRGLF